MISKFNKAFTTFFELIAPFNNIFFELIAPFCNN